MLVQGYLRIGNSNRCLNSKASVHDNTIALFGIKESKSDKLGDSK